MDASTPAILTGLPEPIDARSERIRILYAAIPGSLITILVCSLALAIMLWPVVDHSAILGWLALTNSLSVIRLLLYLRFRRQAGGRLVDECWYRLAVATSIASGVTWGIGGYALFAEQSLVHQVFLGFVLAGMCAGAITTLSAVLSAASGFVITAIVPVIVKFNLVNSEFSLAMTLMSTLFVAMILVSARRINQTIVESLEVRHQRELAEQTILRQAHFDDLTDLPNRRLLLATLRREMTRAERHARTGAVFFVDLDRFKAVNDALGHAVGDELLIESARRIGERLRQEDTVARLGGDEFVVLLPEVGNDRDSASSHANRIANEIRQRFEKPFLIQGHDIHITLSIGIALFPLDAPAEDLLKFADVAMYRAKKEGRNSVRLFSAEMQEAVNQQRVIEKGLRQAMERKEFELYFQAQYDRGHRIVGAEALLRWNHPERGVVAPGYFIDVAEQTGLIVPIGDWIVRSACEHLARFADGLVLSVNLSPRQFADPGFTERLRQIMLETRVDPRRLKFEITEGIAIANLDHTVGTIGVLRRLGVSFAIDDFGTGYSSLSYLSRLPVDELKIDKSFVRDISSASDHAVIVDTIIAMAQQLGLEVVAEGIESAEELDYLTARACDRFQGYYFARPQPLSGFESAVNAA